MRMPILAAALAVISVAPAAAQQAPVCMERPAILKLIEELFEQQRRVTALTADGSAIIELWANEESGMWVIVGTTPDGTTCVILEGRGFEVADAQPEGDLS